MPPIRKLLVANRGEIAIRALRAAAELDITTVAIYTYEDRYSLHRYKADESYQVGLPGEPLKPYLDIEAILEIAKENNVDAIHPGYGFLSENVQFAKRCRDYGIIFVGPSPEAMAALGDKVSGKEVARKAGVPVIEDNREPLLSEEAILKEAKRIGYPVMLKASAGGGGRGMRVITEPDALLQAAAEAKREAGNAFGNDTLFLEKYVDDPKHIEVQILGDRHGNLVHLYERDCSVQRRFQKVVEIAPAPSLKQETKDKLYDYALRIARTVNYDNAGTVEFLVDGNENIYFIEVNPRIQVEHTVTEQVTGIDIVRSQILIAGGERLDSPRIDIPSQETVQLRGFAIQCRITTEDPSNDFKPDFGTLIAYRNAGGYGIRIDEGSSYQGVRVSPYFDSMLVKITAQGRTLNGAANRMLRTLLEFRIRGVKTNIPFLENVVKHPVFREGKCTVRFIEKYPELFEFRQKQDSGTRVLRYLANVMVNGNPDVKKSDPSRTFAQPPLPHTNGVAVPPPGTRQKLQELGAEGFSKWLLDQPKTLFTDTTYRDAHQSLLATRVRTADMLRVAENFATHQPGLFSMEVWGGATFDVALRFLHECPWKRLELLREAIPNICLQMLIRGNNAIGYSAYPDNLVEKFIEESAATGIDIFRIFDSLNWTRSMEISIRAVRERTPSIAEACISYTGNILDPAKTKYNLQYYLDLARKLEDMGAHILCIKDMAGLLKPYAAELLIRELKKVINIPIHLHTHDTAGVQTATYLKAIEAGVDVVDVALASMSGLTSQPNYNSLAEALRHTPYETDINLQNLNEHSNYWETVREWYYPFESELKSGTAEVYEHEIPGGQYSNLKPQAQSLGLDNRMEDIKKSYAEVNLLFGDIVKVTPSSKVVGDMALFMVSNNYTAEDVLTKGEQMSFPASVKSFFKGEIGQPHNGFPEKVQKIILKDEPAFKDLPNAHLKPVDFDKEYAEFTDKYDSDSTFRDFLSWKFYPKVFDEYYQFRKVYGDVSAVPTPAFFYGMKTDEEIMVEIGKGKNILIRLLYVGKTNDEGNCTVYFRLNGQTRSVEVADKKAVIKKESHVKASASTHIGTPLQGLLSRIFVKEGDKVKKNVPLFTIEAMKMETTITAPADMTVSRLVLKEGTVVEADDLVMEYVN